MTDNKIILNVDESYKILKRCRDGYIVAPIGCNILKDEVDDIIRTLEITFNINDVKYEKQFKMPFKEYKQFKTIYPVSMVCDEIFKFNILNY